MNPDPWPAIESLAAERQLDLAPVRQLVEQARSTIIIDPVTAIGNTILDHLNAGASLEEAVIVARQEVTAAVDRNDTGPDAVR